MMPEGQPIAEPFSRGQSACGHFAGQLSGIARDLSAMQPAPLRMSGMLRALRYGEALLRRPLRLAVLGEANSGKSTLVNLLIGNAVIPTLQLSNTRMPTLLRYAPEASVAAITAGGLTVPLGTGAAPEDMICAAVSLPVAHLRDCEVMDFPGFSDPWLGYGAMEIARHRIDAAIWCTFSTQAWKESECTAWRLLPARIRAHSILAVTSKDLLTPEQAPKVMARLRKAAGGDFSRFALLSSLQGRKALGSSGEIRDPALWRTSGAEDFCASVQALLAGIRQHRLEKARGLTNRIAGSALTLLEGAGQ